MTDVPRVHTEVRCVGPHPRFQKMQCRAKLAEVVGPPLLVTNGGKAPKGALVIRCARCGTANVVTAKEGRGLAIGSAKVVQSG